LPCYRPASIIVKAAIKNSHPDRRASHPGCRAEPRYFAELYAPLMEKRIRYKPPDKMTRPILIARDKLMASLAGDITDKLSA